MRFDYLRGIQLDRGQFRILAGFLALITAHSVAAAEINPFDPAVGFNIFVQGNFTNASGQVQGPAAAGGNLTFNSGTIAESLSGSYLAPGDILPSALVVGGSVQWGKLVGELARGSKPANVKIGNPPYNVWLFITGATVINNGPVEAGTTPRIQTSADQTSREHRPNERN